MAYLLDTNAIIAYLKGRSTSLINRVDSTPLREIFLCPIVKSELVYGAMRSDRTERVLAEHQRLYERYDSLVFSDEAAIIAGRERALLAQLGTPIGPHDLQIAGIALANNLTLVTHNIREFQRIDGLQVEDWEG